MARIRSIKPEFFTSTQIVECSTSARLLFVGLWCHCDDAGRHVADNKRLKMEVFPGDDCSFRDVSKWIGELIENGLIVEYSSQGQSYWQVTGWEKHQKIDRPTVKHPGPFDDGSTITRRTLDEPSPPESSRVESSRVELEATPLVARGDACGGLDALIGKWNSIQGVRSCRIGNPKRNTAYRARRREPGWLANVDAALAKVATSGFCRGTGKQNWVADIDWFLKPGTVASLIEGKYDDRNGQQPSSKEIVFDDTPERLGRR